MDRFLAAREQLARPAFWDNAQFWQGIAAALPNYRLSKFQPLMPSWVEHEVLAAYLLDVPGARRWLSAVTGQDEEASVPVRPGEVAS